MLQTATRITLTLALCYGCVYFAGCEPCTPNDTATCFGLPPEDISAFQVTIETGTDGTDADIFFCVESLDASDGACQVIDIPIIDDFEAGSIGTYVVDISVGAGQLTGFFIENRGGAIFGNNDWQIRSITLDALSASGTTLIYDEPVISCGQNVDRGDQYHSARCHGDTL